MIGVHVLFDIDICSWMQTLQLQMEVNTQKYRIFARAWDVLNKFHETATTKQNLKCV